MPGIIEHISTGCRLAAFAVTVLACGLAGSHAPAAFGKDAANAPASKAPRPNIVYILADDMGIGDVGCYGGKILKTPRIDRMAAEGLRFTEAYSGSAVCAPTRCVLMTGKHTGHATIRANRELQGEGQIPLAEGEVTVAQRLKEAGYHTALFGKWGLGYPGSVSDPMKAGFERFFGYNCQRHAHNYFTDWLHDDEGKFEIPENKGGAKQVYSADLIRDRTIGWIKKQKEDQPFFLYAAWTLPHGAYEIPDEAKGPYQDRPWPQAVRNYAAMVERFDRDLGMVLDTLKAQGLDQNTLVVFASDNGANPEFVKPLHSTGELRGVKRFLYEGGIRAPQIVRWPGHVPAGATCNLLTGGVDFMATACELAGTKPPEGVQDGISIVPALLGHPQSATHSHLYWEIHEPYYQQAVRKDRWKAYRKQNGNLELYDLAADPSETTDVASLHPDIAAEMIKILQTEHVESPLWKTKSAAAAGDGPEDKPAGHEPKGASQ